MLTAIAYVERFPTRFSVSNKSNNAPKIIIKFTELKMYS